MRGLLNREGREAPENLAKGIGTALRALRRVSRCSRFCRRGELDSEGKGVR